MNTPNETTPATVPLSFAELRDARSRRWVEWMGHPMMMEDLPFAAMELGGEAGEVLNAIKKLERFLKGVRGGIPLEASKQAIAEELADVIICCDPIAEVLGIDLGAAISAKFNKTSLKYSLGVKMREVADHFADTVQRAQNPEEGDKFVSQHGGVCVTVTSFADGIVHGKTDSHGKIEDFHHPIDDWRKLVPGTLKHGAQFLPAHKEPHLIGKHITVVYQIEDPTAWRASNPLSYAHDGLKALTVSIGDVIDTRDKFRTALETIAEKDPLDSASIAQEALDAEAAETAKAVQR